MTEIVHDDDHSAGSATIGGTRIRVENVADAYEYSGHSPDEIVDLYLALTLQDVHAALAYFYGHTEAFDSTPDTHA